MVCSTTLRRSASVGKSAGSAPNPYSVAQSQTQSNQQTAATQQGYNVHDADLTAGLNRVNQTNASGDTLTYNPTTGAQTTALGGYQQGLSDQLTLGQNLLEGSLNDNTSSSGALNAQSTALQNSILARLQPTEAQQTSTEQTELANQGITPGSSAYENAMLPIQQQQNDLALGAVSTADTEQQQLNQQQLSELSTYSGLNSALENPTFRERATGVRQRAECG